MLVPVTVFPVTSSFPSPEDAVWLIVKVARNARHVMAPFVHFKAFANDFYFRISLNARDTTQLLFGNHKLFRLSFPHKHVFSTGSW